MCVRVQCSHVLCVPSSPPRTASEPAGVFGTEAPRDAYDTCNDEAPVVTGEPSVGWNVPLRRRNPGLCEPTSTAPALAYCAGEPNVGRGGGCSPGMEGSGPRTGRSEIVLRREAFVKRRENPKGFLPRSRLRGMPTGVPVRVCSYPHVCVRVRVSACARVRVRVCVHVSVCVFVCGRTHYKSRVKHAARDRDWVRERAHALRRAHKHTIHTAPYK